LLDFVRKRERLTYNNSAEVGGEKDDGKVDALLRSHGKKGALIVAFNNVVRLSGDDEMVETPD
jgi:hypothetical protein